MHRKCKIGRTSMMVQGLCQVGVCKKCKVVSKATIKELGDNATWVTPPTPKVIRKVETPLEKALAAIVKEMKVRQKSSEKIAQDMLKVLWETLSKTMALVDLVELVVQGKRFVRTQEMGGPESDGEELPVRWLKKGNGKAKEIEPEEEAEEEGEPEEEPEAVDMTLAE